MSYTFPTYAPKPYTLTLHKRPNKSDANAWRLCELIRNGSIDSVAVEWTPSSVWGATAKVEIATGKCSLSSGCGYHKGSDALATALRFLGRDDAERTMINGTGGCGYATVADALASAGYTMKHVYTSPGKYGSEVFSIVNVED